MKYELCELSHVDCRQKKYFLTLFVCRTAVRLLELLNKNTKWGKIRKTGIGEISVFLRNLVL